MAMNREQKRCQQCNFADCDLEMVGGCNCAFHARCLPVDLLAPYQRATEMNMNANNKKLMDTRISCPSCRSINKGMYLYPLTFQDLDLAATYNQQSLRENSGGSNGNSNLNVSQGKSNANSYCLNSSRVRKRGQGYQNNDMEANAGAGAGTNNITRSMSMSIDENSTTSSITAMSQQQQPQPHEGDNSVEYIHSGAVPYLIFSKSNISIASDFSKGFVKNGKKNSDKMIGGSYNNIHANPSSSPASSFTSTSDGQTPNAAPDNDKLHFRTGRWTSAETSYVDLLIQLFDTRQLSSCLPGGIKLNEFLRDLVLCKSSRLTKKYKNAKLSARSFRALVLENQNNPSSSSSSVLSLPLPNGENHCVKLSESQQQFLESIRSNVTRLILKFNMSKMWRIHLSNLCLQIGYQGLYTTDWVKSLDEMEKKVNSEEMNVRRVRRKRMEAALRHDITGNHENLTMNVVVSSGTVDVGGDTNVGSGSKSHKVGVEYPFGNGNPSVIAVPTTSASNPNELKNTKDTVKAIIKRNRSNSGIYFGNPLNGPQNSMKRTTSFAKSGARSMNGSKDIQMTLSSDLVAKVSNASIASSANNHADITSNSMRTKYSEAEAIPVLPLPNDFVPVQQIYEPPQQQNALAQVSPATGPQSETNSSQKDSNDDDFSIGFLDLDDFVGTPYPYLNDKSDDDDSCYQMKSPFTSKIMSFIQSEDLPFQYMDVWVPCTQSSDQSVCLSTASSNDDNASSGEPVRLIHAGDSKRCDLEQIRVMQLNEFGVYSKNYSFDSGAGMPGRVFASASWSWLEGIENASPEQFERIGGAKMCGIRTAVGIPVHSSKIGQIVVGLYSFLNLREDPTLASKLCAEFQNYDPQPKWTLYIDMKTINPTPVPNSVPALTVSANESYNGGSTCAQSVASQTSDLTSVVSHIKREEGLTACEASMIANILAEHIPIEGNNMNVPLSSFISLRLLLLRYPNGCSAEEKKLLFILKMSYDGYARVKKSKREIAELLVKDWIYLNNTSDSTSNGNSGTISSPWGTPMTFVDYATKTTLLVDPSTTQAKATTNSPRFPPLIQPPLPSKTTFFLPAQATSANASLKITSSSNERSPSVTSMVSNSNASEVGDANSKRYLGV